MSQVLSFDSCKCCAPPSVKALLCKVFLCPLWRDFEMELFIFQTWKNCCPNEWNNNILCGKSSRALVSFTLLQDYILDLQKLIYQQDRVYSHISSCEAIQYLVFLAANMLTFSFSSNCCSNIPEKKGGTTKVIGFIVWEPWMSVWKFMPKSSSKSWDISLNM